MAGEQVLDRFQLILAWITIALSALTFVWVILRIMRTTRGPYYTEFNIIVGLTGCTLSVLKYLVAPEARGVLETLSVIGHYMWLASCAVAVALHRAAPAQPVGSERTHVG